VRTLEGHDSWVRTAAVRGPLAISGSYDKTVKVWELEGGTLLQTLQGHNDWVMSAAFSPDGERVAAGSHDGTIMLWRLAAGPDSVTE